ncbi:IclR family transcriptional regulator domain-containing protein [Streptomyces roseus]|uniref:IclR family transcriptional regulator domain-containing protein n=1 Tax=Streptomyces roseus TaxID=66430 RepID=UPI00069EF92C|nr:IclR family transcriptional regulator C-terminal domain-containing protein [Streptomyces roseus]
MPFPQVAHASAVGKSLLAQLDFAGRMDHLARYKPRALTGRTITDPGRLFTELDVHGPHAGQFDLLEYSDKEVCAAFPLAMPGRAACITLSLPANLHPRLLNTAHTLSQHSAGIHLAPPRSHRRHPPHQPTRLNQASKEQSRPRPAMTTGRRYWAQPANREAMAQRPQPQGATTAVRGRHQTR